MLRLCIVLALGLVPALAEAQQQGLMKSLQEPVRPAGELTIPDDRLSPSGLKPNPGWPSEKGRAQGNLIRYLRDKAGDYTSQKEVEQALNNLQPEFDALREGQGYLVGVDKYRASEGELVPGGTRVTPMGPGDSEADAAEKYMARDTLSRTPPGGNLRSEKDSYLLYVEKQGGVLKTSTTPYPFADQVMKNALARVKTKAEAARKLEMERQANIERQARDAALAPKTSSPQTEQTDRSDNTSAILGVIGGILQGTSSGLGAAAGSRPGSVGRQSSPASPGRSNPQATTPKVVCPNIASDGITRMYKSPLGGCDTR